MKKYLTTTLIITTGALLVLVGLITVNCAGTPAPTAPTPVAEAATPTSPPAEAPTVTTAAPELAGDPVRGGLLYDEWWGVIEADAPTTDQPLWQTQTTNTRTGADTWRCKECHGWDYKGVDGAYGSGSHMTGFPGIYAAKDKPAAELLAILRGSTNPDHDFAKVMGEQDLTDLALFMSQAQLDTAELVNADNTVKGDATAGKTQYEKVCINCHGPEGNAINFASIEEPEFVGHLAADNPWEFIHKVRFGQPGWPMPSAITNEWTQQDVANALAYAQSLPTEPMVSGGGPLYDKWWAVIGADEPTTDQPLWQTQTTNTLTGADTWRCKECHGWDYKGVDGAYGSGSHLTGFKGVLNAASMSAEELTAWLTGQKNPDHDFSKVMGEAYLKALVTFMQQETMDVAAYINADKTVNGDPARGKLKFNGTCAACHGLDGLKINFGDASEPEYVGTIAADNPWEFFHKASLGHPGEPMPAGRALGWSPEYIANILAFAQTLPTK
jgi:thiosulfate dehydrogenase